MIVIILPLLHFGQQVISLPVNRSIISQTVSMVFSGKSASGSINFRIRGICSFLFVWDKKPKYRILMKPVENIVIIIGYQQAKA
jgi:hypothetical protein